MPWSELLALVEPYYSKGGTGRKPVGLGIMLRVYFMQQWFALSDPAAVDARYESGVMRRFACIDLGDRRGRRRTRRRFSTSATFSKPTNSAARCWIQ